MGSITSLLKFTSAPPPTQIGPAHSLFCTPYIYCLTATLVLSIISVSTLYLEGGCQVKDKYMPFDQTHEERLTLLYYITTAHPGYRIEHAVLTVGVGSDYGVTVIKVKDSLVHNERGVFYF